MTFRVNTGSMGVDLANPGSGPATINIPAGSFAFTGTGISFKVGTLFELAGNLAVTRQPNGTLESV